MNKFILIVIFTLLVLSTKSQTYDVNGDYKINGKLGVGTADPNEKLVVNGGISVLGSNSVASVNGFYNCLQLINPSHAAIVYQPGTSKELMFGFHSNGNFYWGTGQSAGNDYCMVLSKTGDLTVFNSIGIGATSNLDGYKLNVNGNIRANEIKVVTGWSDFVFANDYRLRGIDEVETFIRNNNHLPDIPTAKEVEENGINLGEMNARLLQKIEELTLYVIDLQKQVDDLKGQLNE